MFAFLASLIGFAILINQLNLLLILNVTMHTGEIASQQDLILHWIAETMVFLFTAGMVSYMNRALSNSLKTVRQNERLLAQRNSQLQNEIIERELAEAQVRELSLEKGGSMRYRPSSATFRMISKRHYPSLIPMLIF